MTLLRLGVEVLGFAFGLVVTCGVAVRDSNFFYGGNVFFDFCLLDLRRR
jgi:hypothetical protein